LKKPGKLRTAFFTIIPVILLDQLTKALVANLLSPTGVITVIPGFFDIVNARNPGAAFGILHEGGLARTLFLVAVSILSLVVVAILIAQSKKRFTDFSLSLIAAGAIGNLIDRILGGEVIDFLDFYIGRYHWPAFNVADSAITVGVFLSILGFYFKKD